MDFRRDVNKRLQSIFGIVDLRRLGYRSKLELRKEDIGNTWTIQQAAEFLLLSDKTIYKYIAENRLNPNVYKQLSGRETVFFPDVLKTALVNDCLIIVLQPNEKYITPEDLALKLNVSPQVIREHLSSREPTLPAVKIDGKWQICWSATKEIIQKYGRL